MTQERTDDKLDLTHLFKRFCEQSIALCEYTQNAEGKMLTRYQIGGRTILKELPSGEYRCEEQYAVTPYTYDLCRASEGLQAFYDFQEATCIKLIENDLAILLDV